MAAVGARWQPGPSSLIVDGTRGMRLDPSAANRELGSKIIIDATRKLPNEGGPEVYPKLNRALLKEMCPEAFDLVDDKWASYVKDFEG